MKKFLIADDSVPKTFFLQKIIKNEQVPCVVLTARSSEEAKKVIDANPDIAAAFIDYEIPSENGPAIIRYLKSKNPNAVVALVTAFNTEKYHQDGTDAGAEAFVCTTFQEDDVVRTLRSLLAGWKEVLVAA
jgi:DNA-binding NarL/FixJ family response regulator